MAVQELDTDTSRRDYEKLAFNGYHTRDIPPPDPLITETGPGTPMGEYFRRFWIPVCLSEELTDLPKAIRILSEDLVAFRDKSGRVGVLHRHCSHRGTSLEYGIVSERGIRCCYHGWLFDVDGTILETPGEPPDSKLKDGFYHGAYPAFEMHGLVHAYMGPPELKPDKPHLDFFEMPGVQFAPFAIPYKNNWLNSHENNVDPVHSVFLHERYALHFEHQAFAVLPNLKWQLTGDGDGMMYMSVRRLDEEWIWARILHCRMPFESYVPSVWDLQRPTYYQPGFYLRRMVPVDDRNSIFFGWRAHGTDRFEGGDPGENGWNLIDMGGQVEKPTYEEKQREAGDWEAQGSVWYGVPRPDIEHPGATDGGVMMMRRGLRNIVEGNVPAAWPKPEGSDGDKPAPTKILSQDSVLNIKERPDPDEDWELLGTVGEKITEVVIEGSGKFVGQERDDWIIERIKKIEAEYRG